MHNTYESVLTHPTFVSVFDKLVENQFYIENNMFELVIVINIADMEKACWLASVLANSSIENNRLKALTFATLAYIQNHDNELLKKFCYVIQSRTGNLPASMHIEDLLKKESDGNESFKSRFGNLLELELSLNRVASTIDVGETELVVTQFQHDLWQKLNSKSNITISAPTSAGKSYMIQSYIVNKCICEEEFKAIYIVPSRALIYQVSMEFKKRLQNTSAVIRTGFGNINKTDITKKEIYVITPERSLKLIEDYGNKIIIDFIFVDEIQNIEDSSRGVLLEYALNEILNKWPKAKAVIAGPFIDNSIELFKDIFAVEAECASTVISPVFQLKYSIQLIKGKKQFLLQIYSPSGTIITREININQSLYSKFKSSMGNALVYILEYFGGDSTNIIYSPRTNFAENWAVKIAENYSEIPDIELDIDVKNLIDYLSEEIHVNYSLIRCLKRGVAYHHAGLPDIARNEIEHIYANKKDVIKNLVCTSTLLEGVNLPAQKIFVLKPEKGGKVLENFEFGNLIGRAGRMSKHLYGSVYCIETEDEIWALDKLESECTKDIIPFSKKVLMENTDDIVNRIASDFDVYGRDKYFNAVCFLRHKYLKSKSNLVEYLEQNNISEDNIIKMVSALERKFDKFDIPAKLLSLNPTIDPLLQKELYQRMKRDGLDNWMINKYPYNSLKQDMEEQSDLEFNDKSFFWQFYSVFHRLCILFGIEDEIKIIKSFNTPTIIDMCVYGVSWIRGRPYKSLIDNKVKYRMNTNTKIDLSEIDTIIRNVTKDINNIVRFIMVKYFKLWSDYISYFLDEHKREEYKYFLSLPNMLEMGADNPKALELMSLGITRSVALYIASKIPSSFNGSFEDWFKNNGNIVIPELYRKHLRLLGFDL